MKKLNKIKLTSLSKKELNNRELGKVLGGENCCTCSCLGEKWASQTGGSVRNYSGNTAEQPGYGFGAFAPSQF